MRKYRIFSLTVSVLALLIAAGCATPEGMVRKSEQELKEMEAASQSAYAAFLAGDYDRAEALLLPLIAERTVSQPLYLAEYGVILMAKGKREDAQRIFLTVQAQLETMFDAQAEEKAASLWGRELNKVYKGDPYERASLYIILGIFFLDSGDVDNALACFKSGMLADADVADDAYSSDFALLQLLAARCHELKGDRDNAVRLRRAAARSIWLSNPEVPLQFEPGVEAVLRYEQNQLQAGRLRVKSSDAEMEDEWREGLLLEAETLEKISLRSLLTEQRRKLEDRQNIRVRSRQTPDSKLQAQIDGVKQLEKCSDAELNDYREKQREINPFDYLIAEGPFAAIGKSCNALVVVWNGRGPAFYRHGSYGEIRSITPGRLAADGFVLRYDGKSYDPLRGIGNLNYQATTRGLRKMDELLLQQAAMKRATETTGNVLLVSGLALMQAGNLYTTGIGAGLLVTGGIVHGVAYLMTPEADIRHWKNLPYEFSCIPLQLPPGTHRFSVISYAQGSPIGIRSFELEVNERSPLVTHQAIVGNQGESELHRALARSRGTLLSAGPLAAAAASRAFLSESEVSVARAAVCANFGVKEGEDWPESAYQDAVGQFLIDFKQRMLRRHGSAAPVLPAPKQK